MEWLGLDFSGAQLFVLAVSAFLGGFSKTGIIGMGIVITPLMASVFPAGSALGMLVPLYLVGDVISVTRFNRTVPWRVVRGAVPWGMAGIVLGWILAGVIGARFGNAADRVLRVLIGALMGCVVIFGHLFSRRRERIARADSNGGRQQPISLAYTATLCIFGGFAAMLTNSAGPIWAVYFASLDFEVKEVIAGGIWVHFLCNLAKFPFSANLGFFNTSYVPINLLLVPVIIAGLYAGSKVAGRYSKKTFARILQILTVCGAGYMIIS